MLGKRRALSSLFSVLGTEHRALPHVSLTAQFRLIDAGSETSCYFAEERRGGGQRPESF